MASITAGEKTTKKKLKCFVLPYFYTLNIVPKTKYTGHMIYESCCIIYDHNTLSCLMLIWKTLLVSLKKNGDPLV